MKKIDFHTHILPPDWPNLRERYGYGGWVQLEDSAEPNKRNMTVDGKFFRAVKDNCYAVEPRFEDMDATGVDMQVICTVPIMFAYWAEPQHTHDLAVLLNDHCAEVVAAHPTKFLALGTVPLNDTARAIKELERCKSELGFRGVQIGSHVNGTNLDDASLFPFFEACQALDMALVVHPWDMLARERMTKYWHSWLVGMPAEVTLAISSMIFGGVFERLPKLRVCFGHGGGAFPFTVGRIQHGFDTRPDLCAVDNPKGPREYIGHFWVDSITHDADAFRYILKLFGADKVILGSDYPFPLGEHHPGKMIEEMGDEISEETRRKINYRNTFEFLGMKEEAKAQ